MGLCQELLMAEPATVLPIGTTEKHSHVPQILLAIPAGRGQGQDDAAVAYERRAG